ncbi:MAG: hypothetical protein AB1941_24485 [Gemmatimonadota bacterium]
MGSQAEAATAAKPAGDAETLNEAPTIDDFIPRLSAAALVPGLDEGIASTRLALSRSLDHEYTRYIPAAVRLGVELHKPEVFQPLMDSVREARRSAIRERFEKEFGEFDDIELTGGINLETRWLGRRYEPHRQELEALLPAPAGQAWLDAENQFQLFLSRLQPQSGAAADCASGDPWDRPMECYSDADRAGIEQRLDELFNLELAYPEALETWAKQSGWAHLPDLLNNQPQFNVHASWRTREHDATGPESFTIRARYEAGLVNLNAVRRFCERRRGGYVDGRFDPTCFRNHVTSELNQGLLRLGIRGFLQAEAVRDRSFRAPFLESDSAAFSTPAGWGLKLTGGIGGFLPTGGSVQSSRIDLAFGLGWADRDDPARPARRATANLSLTQRLTSGFSLLSGLVWSDRGEFEDEDVTPVRLKLGVRYKLVPTPR